MNDGITYWDLYLTFKLIIFYSLYGVYKVMKFPTTLTFSLKFRPIIFGIAKKTQIHCTITYIHHYGTKQNKSMI